jgi:hypothetical protein
MAVARKATSNHVRVQQSPSSTRTIPRRLHLRRYFSSEYVSGQRLGAPGPQNLGSPLTRTSTFGVALLDSNFPATSQPNRARDLTSVTNGANGTLVLRRRFVNNTGAAVTQLRLRVIDISSLAVPAGIADIRTLTSSNMVINGITDAATCLAANGVATTPCSVNVVGTTLEQPLINR